MTTDLLVAGDALTTPDNYDPKVKASAYELFLTTSLDLTDIAISLSIPAKVVGSWARCGKWLDRKHDIEKALFQSADDKYRSMIIATRAPTLERHIRASAKIEALIEDLADLLAKAKENGGSLPDGVTKAVMQTATLLEKLSKAHMQETGISARSAAISDDPFGTAAASKNQLPSLVVINNGEKPSFGPQPPEGRVYDMKSVGVEPEGAKDNI